MPLSKEDFGDLIQGKRVAVVGPAHSLVEFPQGDYIDSFDVVVRANGHQPLHRDLWHCYGKRTDIYYCNKPEPHWTRVPYLVYNICPSVQRKRKAAAGLSPTERLVDRKLMLALGSRIGCRPHTGVAAIWELLHFGCSELYVCGMTFYRGRKSYVPEYQAFRRERRIKSWARHEHHTRHDADREFELFVELMGREPRVKIDEGLRRIIHGC